MIPGKLLPFPLETASWNFVFLGHFMPLLACSTQELAQLSGQAEQISLLKP